MHFGPEAKQRLINYFDQAMMRWAAKRGRYDVLEPLQALRAAELAAAGGAGATAHVAGAAAGVTQQQQQQLGVADGQLSVGGYDDWQDAAEER